MESYGEEYFSTSMGNFMETTVPVTTTLSGEDVEMGVEAEQGAEGLYDGYDTGHEISSHCCPSEANIE